MRLNVLGSAAASIKADWTVNLEISVIGDVTLTLPADLDAIRPSKLTVAFLPPNFAPNSLDAATILSSYPHTDTLDVPVAVAGQATILQTSIRTLNPGNYTAVAVGEFN